MKPNINLISVFERKQEGEEGEYHTGTLDASTFKKAKGEIRIILMKGHMLPLSIVGSDPRAQENLFMFVEENNQQE